MHILVINGNYVEAEFRAKFGPGHQYSFFTTEYTESAEWERIKREIEAAATEAEVAFCFNKIGYNAMAYLLLDGTTLPVFFEITSASLTQSHWQAEPGHTLMKVFGFCGLPTLLNRPLLEVSLHHESDREKLAETCAALGTDYRIVADRVGLVTPRVICQIINEACFTVQEGTATMQDVDLGMKLGTNYPRGPFAWANAIGVERVYAVLEAMWDDTHDERYKVCPLLKRQALRGEPFAV